MKTVPIPLQQSHDRKKVAIELPPLSPKTFFDVTLYVICFYEWILQISSSTSFFRISGNRIAISWFQKRTFSLSVFYRHGHWKYGWVI